MPLSVCNKRCIESLIKAGAFDSMGHSRRALMDVFETAVDGVIDLKRNQANGQDDLFGDLGGGDAESDPAMNHTVPDIPDWDKRTKLAFEREMLGLYVSDHPLRGWSMCCPPNARSGWDRSRSRVPRPTDMSR